MSSLSKIESILKLMIYLKYGCMVYSMIDGGRGWIHAGPLEIGATRWGGGFFLYRMLLLSPGSFFVVKL